MIKPKKSLGQNFLKDSKILAKIIQTADLNPSDHVIEVGAGKGVLTRELVKACKVTAIELDNRLIPLLNEIKGAEIIHDNALDFIPPEGPYKVVANIPYYITSPLISHFLEAKNKPGKMVLLIQKEVAEKMCAEQGQYNVLALHVQIFGKPRIVCKVPPSAFTPQPKVDSAVIEIDVYEKPLVEDYKALFRLVHMAFHQKRKTLHNSLQLDNDILEKAGIDPMARPQHLSIEDWIKLLKIKDI